MIKSKRKKLVGLAFLLAAIGAAGVWSPAADCEPFSTAETTLFIEANMAYENNEFAAAEEKYKGILDGGVESGEVLYNLGNCYFRMGELGMAIVFYERARRLMPRNQNVVANILLAESRALDKITPPKVWAVAQKLFVWRRMLTAREISSIFIAANAVFWASLAALAIVKNRFVKIAVVLAGIILILSGASYALGWTERRGLGTAVVVPDEAEVRTGPGNYAVKFKLHDGTRLKLVDSREEWYQIRLADGKRGWMQTENVEKI
jgi:tetratricopeptide (TPR) repeat protein